MKQDVFTIIGPTGSGKTSFTLKLARKIKKSTGFDAEIISADSRQVYKYISITTAQPSISELREFKHYFISELELNEEFNAGEFGIKGREVIDDIFKRGRIPIITGGSGLYISSLIYGLFEYRDEILKEEIIKCRKKLYGFIVSEGLEALITRLQEVDPESMAHIRKSGITERRIVRALEVYMATGVPISDLKRKKPEIGFRPRVIGLHFPREKLYNRINRRTDEMLQAGMVDEIMSLREKGFHYKQYNSLNTVGAKETFDYLDGKISLEEMKELIKRNTRRFAKRQLTWFRRYEKIKWIDAENESEREIDLIISDLVKSKSER